MTHDETTIIAGALELSEKTASDAMTPIAETFAIDINAKLDRFITFQYLNGKLAVDCITNVLDLQPQILLITQELAESNIGERAQ